MVSSVMHAKVWPKVFHTSVLPCTSFTHDVVNFNTVTLSHILRYFCKYGPDSLLKPQIYVNYVYLFFQLLKGLPEALFWESQELTSVPGKKLIRVSVRFIPRRCPLVESVEFEDKQMPRKSQEG